jgi:hypothetical protein
MTKSFFEDHVARVVNELTRNADPIKLYDYVATGKPLVSTDLPASRRFKDVFKIAKSYDDFEHSISERSGRRRHQLSFKRVKPLKKTFGTAGVNS